MPAVNFPVSTFARLDGRSALSCWISPLGSPAVHDAAVKYCVIDYMWVCGYLQLMVKLQHTAMVPASVNVVSVPRHSEHLQTCMLSCRTPGIICTEMAGASSIYICLPGVEFDNKGYMPQPCMASAQELQLGADSSCTCNDCAGRRAKAGCCCVGHPGCSCQHSPSPFPQAQASAYRCPGHTHKPALLPVKFLLSLHLLCAALPDCSSSHKHAPGPCKVHAFPPSALHSIA